MSRSLPGPAHLVTVARPRAHAIEPENLGTRIWPARTVRVRRPGPPGQLAGSQPARRRRVSHESLSWLVQVTPLAVAGGGSPASAGSGPPPDGPRRSRPGVTGLGLQRRPRMRLTQ